MLSYGEKIGVETWHHDGQQTDRITTASTYCRA